VAARMGAADVLEALYPLLLKRGRPDYIRSDNVLRQEHWHSDWQQNSMH
jgi:hypothetical protein